MSQVEEVENGNAPLTAEDFLASLKAYEELGGSKVIEDLLKEPSARSHILPFCGSLQQSIPNAQITLNISGISGRGHVVAALGGRFILAGQPNLFVGSPVISLGSFNLYEGRTNSDNVVVIVQGSLVTITITNRGRTVAEFSGPNTNHNVRFWIGSGTFNWGPL